MRFLTALLAALVAASPVAFAHEAVCPELTTLQVAAGFVTLANIAMVAAIIVGVGAFAVLFRNFVKWLLQIFLAVPAEVYEVLGYVSAVLLIASGWLFGLSGVNETWTSLIGCLWFGGMLMITGYLHELKADYRRFFGTLFVVWSAVALFYANAYVGFAAVAAFMGLLGFSAMVIPFGYAIGFRDEAAVARGTAAALVILGAAVAIRVFSAVAGVTVPFFGVFEQGALWLGSFVGYLGLLIVSSIWYPSRGNYALIQATTIALGLAAVVVGTLFAIPQLMGIGGTFFALYLIEKPYDLKPEGVTAFAGVCLFVSVCVGLAAWWAQNHMDLIGPYLLF